jgi:quercetin dioxygenase-like cupin family protein
MKVLHLKDIEEKENSASLFTAPVTLQAIQAPKENSPGIAYVHFPDGVRNKLHTHNNDQILIVTEGSGKVATEQEEKDIAVGDLVIIPAGEKHWHGAVPGSPMTHIAISAAETSIEQVEK